MTLKRVREATAEDLKSAANRWLGDGVYIAEVHAIPRLQGRGGQRGPLPSARARPAARLKLPKLQRATLSNGLKVILAERHEVPLVNFWLATDAGYAADQFATPGTAKLTGTLLIDGTNTRSALRDQRPNGAARRAASGQFQSRLLVRAALGTEAQARSLA